MRRPGPLETGQWIPENWYVAAHCATHSASLHLLFLLLVSLACRLHSALVRRPQSGQREERMDEFLWTPVVRQENDYYFGDKKKQSVDIPATAGLSLSLQVSVCCAWSLSVMLNHRFAVADERLPGVQEQRQSVSLSHQSSDQRLCCRLAQPGLWPACLGTRQSFPGQRRCCSVGGRRVPFEMSLLAISLNVGLSAVSRHVEAAVRSLRSPLPSDPLHTDVTGHSHAVSLLGVSGRLHDLYSDPLPCSTCTRLWSW